ncbi:phosphoglycerate mutase, partial [Rhizoctonia solani]
MESRKVRASKLKLLGKEEGSHPSGMMFGALNDSPPTANPAPEEKQAQFDHALKIQIISWNMNDTLPKGDLAALLGAVPPYGSDSPNPTASDFQLDDTGHPYHIIVIAGQECPTGLLPMGMGAVKMERSKDIKAKSKEEDGSPNKHKKPRRSEEEELQPLNELPPVKDAPPLTPTVQGAGLPHTGQIQHSSGWSALLEDWYSKGLGAKRFSLEDWQMPTSPVMAAPPSPVPSRSPSLPALPLPPAIPDPAKLTVPPSPRRMSTLIHGHPLSNHSNGHAISPTEQGPYTLVAKERLMGIYMAVYVHRETRSLVRGFSKSSVTAGLIGGRLGNKGGVGISLNVAGSSFLFVNAHLAAHEGRQAMRIENMEKIQAELKLDNFGEHPHPRKPIPDFTKTDITNAFDYTFIFGDLNFRLSVSRLHADWLISRQDYHQAQEFDELRTNMRSNKIFPGFEEPEIRFPPTFKYDVPKSRHHHSRRQKEGRDKSGKVGGMGGVRASIRRSRKRRKSRGKIKGVAREANGNTDEGEDEKVSGLQTLQPVNERETEVSSIGEDDSDMERDQEQDQELDSVSAFSAVARPSGSTNRPPSTRSHRSGIPSTRSPFSEPDTELHDDDENDTACEDGEDTSLHHNTQLNAGNAPGRNAVLKIFTRNARQSWRAIVAKSTSSLGAVNIPKSPTSPIFDSRPRAKSPSKSERFSSGIGLGLPERLRGVSTGPHTASGLSTPTAGVAMGRSQPNLVLDTSMAEPAEELKPRASVDGNRNVTGALGIAGMGGTLAPPPMIRANSSVGSTAGNSLNAQTEDSSDSENVRGVYDTSSKQRVPSWCDRIVYKSMVLPPQPPPSLPVPTFSASLADTLHEDNRFGRVGNLFTGIRHLGTRGRKDSLPQPNSRENTQGSLSRTGSLRLKEAGSKTNSNYVRTREAHLSESRASPFLQQPGDGDDSGIVIMHGNSSRPGSSGRSGKGSSSKRPGSAGSTGTANGDAPASLHWPRTNPFARLLHPHHHHTPGGPGLIHAVSMEPQPQPTAEPGPIPRPRSFSTSEGREKLHERAGSGPRTPRQSDSDADNIPVPPSKDDGIWRFFRSFNREPTVVVAEPEPEPEPVEKPETRRRGDIVCLSYGTLDDREMQRLGGRSDHRPVIDTMTKVENKVCLIVHDGWGVSDVEKGNAVKGGDTTNMDTIAKDHSARTLQAHGLAVGLSDGLMGNSEVGHLNIGAGRIVWQDIVRIDVSIKKREFHKNKTILESLKHAKNTSGRLHLLGLVSDGGVHSHINHLKALLETAKEIGVPKTIIHFVGDGRDTAPRSSSKYLKDLLEFIQKEQYGEIGTIVGRYYAMDRDKRWERVKVAIDGLVSGEGESTSDPVATIEERYKKDETDEFLKPIILDKDTIFFFNYRSDRMREIVSVFGLPDKPMEVTVPKDLHITTMSRYNAEFPFNIAFPPQAMTNVLAEWLAKKGLKQCHIAETEKYAHVTFFFNGGVEKQFEQEERELIPSPKVATYDKQPEMSAQGVADKVAETVAGGKYDFVGHTGVYEAAVQAITATDKAVKTVYDACQKAGYVLAITADHGNAEQMINPETGNPHTAHTTNPVPFIITGDPSKYGLVGDEEDGEDEEGKGALADVAPTILDLMGLDKPEGKPAVAACG